MRREWEPEELIAWWTLVEGDAGLIGNKRRNAAAEAREEALFELGMRAQRPRASLTADKHRVADFLRPTLAFAALQCADAAHELEDRQFPGTAGSTMLDLAASLLSDGDEIATAAGYSAWPGLGGGW